MEPVTVGQTPVHNITAVAGVLTHYGAVVVRTAAGKAAATKATGETNILGVVVNDEVEHTPYDGFFNLGEVMTVRRSRARVWVVANGANINIDAGDYLEVADLGSGSQAGRHGILEEAGSAAGATRTATTVAQALEDVIMGSGTYKIPENVAVGDTTITFTSGYITTMGLKKGDYILLEDITGDLQINRVKKVDSATQITLEMPSTVALTKTDSDLVTKMFQCVVDFV